MISWICLKLKQLFCRHRNTYFKEATALEKRYWKYGKVICKDCGKVVKEIVLFDEKGGFKK